MHTFEVKIPISESVCQKLLKIPHMERASERVFRSNCYTKKGIKQIELREYCFSMDGLNKVKIHYLVFRCNANQLLGNDPLFVLDTETYSGEDLLSALQKRIYEIPEFQELKKADWLSINVNYATTDRADVSKDIFTDTPSLYVYLCNMGFPYHYYNMERVKIQKLKETLYYESCYFSSKSRTVNIYLKKASVENKGEAISEGLEGILARMLRLEIQIKRQGIKNMARKLEHGRQLRSFSDLGFLDGYLKKIIGGLFGKEKHVSHQQAKERIAASGYKGWEKTTLLSILEMVNQISLFELEKAIREKEPYVPKEYGVIRYFKSKWLKMFQSLGMNPVTIPDSYGIEELPSLYGLLGDAITNKKILQNLE